jgi:hypothetical protein
MEIMEVMMVPNGDQVLNSWKRTKTKTKCKGSRQKYNLGHFVLLVRFRIDSCTIKRGTQSSNAVSNCH